MVADEGCVLKALLAILMIGERAVATVMGNQAQFSASAARRAE